MIQFRDHDGDRGLGRRKRIMSPFPIWLTMRTMGFKMDKNKEIAVADVTIGKVLYENPLTHGVGREEWFMEGGGAATWEDDCLRLRSRWFSVERSRVETDHFTIWLNREFPSDVAIEWEFRYPPKEQNADGLAILFWGGKGLKGEDVLDPKLAKRNGIFERYYDGDINCFHTSYLAIGRHTANLRKKGFSFAGLGGRSVERGRT